MKIKFLRFSQPIGEFALCVLSVNDILKISHIDRREFDTISLNSKGGPQREPSTKRIKEITNYSESPDATFPTPILLALPENKYKIDKECLILREDKIASIVDGQHRILGLENSKYRDDFHLPVVFILDATEEQKALIFAIINGKQTRVSASIIYDLFSVIENRNPFKTAHEIARSLNSDEKSPFYRRLKMLGKKMSGSNESLSQGTFVTQLLKLITNNPSEDFNLAREGKQFPKRIQCVFNDYFINDKDEVILKILLNLFKSVQNVFPDEWEDSSKFVLSKTTGFTGIIKSLPELIESGNQNKDLSYEYFHKIFISLRNKWKKEKLNFTSTHFPPNNSGESKLRDEILSAARNGG
ncbi:DGQHR domain-containing protein [Leptospira levettii]|uniref:DGQHR domain-containing protein n=1 Tax=Leptospira levettii TaxID=2023178 RepID=UPI00108482BF|nr:DGQHR domain-containing protein [Leptospira levettii]TGM73566.1 DGQHR domain-containing protein [Leptospira levettii]